MWIITKIIISVLEPFMYICNLSFSKGIFPLQIKIAKDIPIFKSGDKSQFNNNRPISVHSQFSKILENLFHKILKTYIDKHVLLSDNQYGFRSNRSTSLALLELVEKITKSIDDGKYIIGIFIDIKKAFDTIDHNILLQKLHFLGVRGVANSWLTSYLSKRMQYVEVCECMSDLLQVKYGVPQGSVLGPLLFILYINDICNVSKVFDCILFADDTNLLCSDNDINDLCEIINLELDKLNTWSSFDKLSLNIQKTKLLMEKLVYL